MAPSGSSPARLTWMMVVAVLTATAHASRLLTALQQNFEGGVVRAELIHRDHPDSPLAPPEGTTLGDRWAAAAKRSENLAASRGRRLSSSQTPLTRIGDFQGEYVMSISFGTPPQKFIGLVDTGSHVVWIQCAPCTGCFSFQQPDPFYDPARSSSEKYISCTDPLCGYFITSPCSAANNNTCRIDLIYGDNSTTYGTLMREVLTFSNTKGANPVVPGFVFACMNNNTGIFDDYDGIIGFSRSAFSLPSQLSAISYLHVFSYCLVPFKAATTNTSSMQLGQSNCTNARGLVYTPLQNRTDSANYYVNMTGISVNGVAVDIPASLFGYNASSGTGGVLFDSGTPVTRFVLEIYTALRNAVASATPSAAVALESDFADRLCFNISGDAAPVYPNVTFHFDGVHGDTVDFDLGPDNAFGPPWFGPYLNQPAYQSDVSCLAVVPGLDNIIGNVAQANHYIEIDATVDMRIGWVTQDCTA